MAFTALFFLSKIWDKERLYVLLFLGPVDRKILNTKPFPEVGYDFRNSVDDMCNFIADDKLNVLKLKRKYFGGELITHEETVLDLDRA